MGCSWLPRSFVLQQDLTRSHSQQPDQVVQLCDGKALLTFLNYLGPRDAAWPLKQWPRHTAHWTFILPLPHSIMFSGKGHVLPSVPACIFHECFWGGKRLA